LKNESDRLYKYEWEIRKQFVLAHPKSIVSLQELLNWTSDANYKEAKAIYDGLDPAIKKTEKAKEIEVRLANLEKVALGNPATDFTQKDIHGKDVSLSSYKGNYVLLEFWASWCGPCRAENPNLRAAYEKYKDKGLNILAVSLDDDSGKWKKAVEKDALPWAQVSDLKGWSNIAAIQYGVRGIPANFLIDPQGKIVKRDLRGEELNKALAELFN
jgi:peroxiredoxin